MGLLILEDCNILWTKPFDGLGMIWILCRERTFLEKVENVAQFVFLCVVLDIEEQLPIGEAGEGILPDTKSAIVMRNKRDELVYS